MLNFHLPPNAPRPVAPFFHAVERDGWIILTGQMPTALRDAPVKPWHDGGPRRSATRFGGHH